MARKHKPLPPRRKRMRRAGRLQAARHWLPTFKGKNVVRGYRRWFGVDIKCALIELQMLGVKLDPVHVERLECTIRNWGKGKSRRGKKDEQSVPDDFECCYCAQWEDFAAAEEHPADRTFAGQPPLTRDNPAADDDWELPF